MFDIVRRLVTLFLQVSSVRDGPALFLKMHRLLRSEAKGPVDLIDLPDENLAEPYVQQHSQLRRTTHELLEQSAPERSTSLPPLKEVCCGRWPSF